MYGKYHDYKSVDLRDIMSLFDDYLNVETSIKNRYNWIKLSLSKLLKFIALSKMKPFFKG